MADSSFAEAARARKVAAYVIYLDGMFRECGYHPYDDAAECVAWLRVNVGEEDWKKYAAAAAEQNKPSQTTVDAIFKTYDDRAEAAKAQQQDDQLRGSHDC